MREISTCPVEIVSKDLAVMTLAALTQLRLLLYEAVCPCCNYWNQPSCFIAHHFARRYRWTGASVQTRTSQMAGVQMGICDVRLWSCCWIGNFQDDLFGEKETKTVNIITINLIYLANSFCSCWKFSELKLVVSHFMICWYRTRKRGSVELATSPCLRANTATHVLRICLQRRLSRAVQQQFSCPGCVQHPQLSLQNCLFHLQAL